jgi:hypothetical protein
MQRIVDKRSAAVLVGLLDDPEEGVRFVVANHGHKQKSDRLDAAIVKKAKMDSHNPKGLEDALKVVLTADQLMMQKLLEIGDITKEL